MNQGKQHRTKRFRWKISGYVLLSLLAVTVMLRLSLNTGFVRVMVKDRLIAMANEQLTVSLSVGEVKGDLWKEIILKDVVLDAGPEGEAEGRIDSLRVGYNLLSYFQEEFQVSELAIHGPFLKLRQQQGELNVVNWVKAGPKDTAVTEPFRLRIADIRLRDGTVDAVLDILQTDSSFVGDAIRLDGSFALLDEGYEANVTAFSFDLLETRLDEKISFSTTLTTDKKTISLEKLVLASGNSVLRSSGNVNLDDTTGNIGIEVQPLSWRDIAAYVDQYPVEKNIALNFRISGSPERFGLGLRADAPGIEGFEINTALSWDSTLILREAGLHAERLNLADFLDDPEMPDLSGIRFKANGHIPLTDYRTGNFEATLSTEAISYENFSLDSFNSTFSLLNRDIQARLEVKRKQEELIGELGIKEVWDPVPALQFTVKGGAINPGYWLQEPDFYGDLAFTGTISGNGLIPGEADWKYKIDVEPGSIAEQNFNRVSMHGKWSQNRITNNTLLRLLKSELHLEAQVNNYGGYPKFSYSMVTSNFNLAECRDMEEFSSELNVDIRGTGQGSTLGNLEMKTTIQVDTSIVNGERVDKFNADIAINDTVAKISSGELRSNIAEGSFDARMHLKRWYDTGNELNMNFILKNLQSLAPLMAIDSLQAEGSVKGRLAPIYAENLKFTGDVDLSNIQYNRLFTADKATGTVETLVTPDPEFVVDLELVSPFFSGIHLQDLFIQTRGQLSGERLNGTFSLNFFGPKESEILHAGSYRFAPDSILVTTGEYRIKSSLHTLSLERPFDILISRQAIQMDTMRVSSPDGTTLELAVPYADTLQQQGHLFGKNLNLTVIQNTLLGESFIEGILSGNLKVINTKNSFDASGDLLFTDLGYKGILVDSLRLDLAIGNNQLNGRMLVNDQGKELVNGELNVPFRLGDPLEFDEEFFDKPVEGSLTVNRILLSRFDTLLTEMGIGDTDGILNGKAELSGIAGEPKMTGGFSIDSALISGVQIDSITADVQYVHESSLFSLDASVNSLKQRAAVIKAGVPLHIDLRRGEVNLPDEQDSIFVDINTNNFDLAAFNDFVDRNQVRNIKGKVNGMVHVNGTIEEFDAKGRLDFTESSVRIVKTGVTISDMRATLNFKPDLVTLSNFRAKSGSGSLNMNGSMAFEQLVPGGIDLSLKASNFRIANTSQYNATINLDTRVTGSYAKPEIKGSLSVLNGFVQLDNFGEKSVENVRLAEEAPTDASPSVFDSLALDMDISFGRRFFIRNQRYLEMEVELNGSVDLVKDTGKELQMFGAVEAVSGYARPLGKRFELEEGIVTFTGDPSNPELNIRTIFEPPQPKENIMIWYIIEGSVEDPQFKYESSPPMELEDILCYTLFGQPCFALESWKRAVASSGSNSTAADLALDVLADRIESLATQNLGIDVVKIDNTRVGGETGTSITTGWYLNPKVFFAIQNVITGSTPDTSFFLEYMLQENLMLIISQGGESGQGIDLKWHYDY